MLNMFQIVSVNLLSHLPVAFHKGLLGGHGEIMTSEEEGSVSSTSIGTKLQTAKTALDFIVLSRLI